MRRAILSTLIVLTSCGGSWSNRDLEFLKVLPSRAQLAATLPQTGSTSQGLTGTRRDRLAVGDPSQVYADTKAAVASFNGLLEFILAVPEAARKVPPTSRSDDSRVWGPFADKGNPGFEARLTITEESPQRFTWALESRKVGGDYFPVITGSFKPTASLTQGEGEVDVPVASFRDQLKVTADVQQLDDVKISYKTDQAPRWENMIFTFRAGAVSGLSHIGYLSTDNGDGSGSLDYQVRSVALDVTAVDVHAAWTTPGDGRALGTVTEGTFTGSTREECWDSAFTVVYAKQGWPGGATVGNVADCVQIPGF